MFIVQLGSSEKVPALSCEEIKKSSSEASSGRYWLDPSVSGSPISVYCDLANGGEDRDHVILLVFTAINRTKIHHFDEKRVNIIK